MTAIKKSTEPRDIPVIFSAPMVVAHLEGRKHMTRRLAYRQKACTEKEYVGTDDFGKWRDVPSPWRNVKPGDRMWVRENFAYVGTSDPGFLTYGATYPGDLAKYGVENVPATLKEAGYKWTPCIHMPRKVSRLTLIVTAVKIEPLQDISEADAIAEGISRKKICGLGESWTHYGNPHGPVGWIHAVQSFQSLWESLHGAESWNANPEVVAISYRVIKANIDSEEARAAA